MYTDRQKYTDKKYPDRNHKLKFGEGSKTQKFVAIMEERSKEIEVSIGAEEVVGQETIYM